MNNETPANSTPISATEGETVDVTSEPQQAATRPNLTPEPVSADVEAPVEPAVSPAATDAFAALLARVDDAKKDSDLPPFTASDYANFLTGSGAEKLADSGVAPLVAAARGYKKIDGTNFATEMRVMGFNRSTKQGKRLQKSLNGAGNDGLQMPWFSLSSLAEAAKKGDAPIPFTYQLRPGRPENNDHGKPVKYEFLAGVGTPLDAHPSVSPTWIDETPIVMIAEGLLKGDSALTSYLHKHGASWSELADGSEGASTRLTSLLNNIPQAERILILSIAGINNTTQNPIDWRNINLRDREAWIAFDADVDKNIHVWRAASKLWLELENREKVDRVRMLSPRVTVDMGLEKAGIDDYLAKIGTWDDLLQHMSTGLPDAPVVDAEEIPGAWRISKDGLSAEECMPIKGGPNGEITGYHWQKMIGLGGRISVTEQRRQPTDTEMKTGKFETSVSTHDIEDSQVEIEVSWLGADGENHTVAIMGPEIILNYTPVEWERKGATIPSALLHHPAWPPRNQNGEKWASAIKAHRYDEMVQRTRWMQMGWVPVPGGEPVFLVGDQVVGSAQTEISVSGVDEREINVASKFGVGDVIPSADFDDPKYKAAVLSDLEVVLDAYIRSNAFTDRSTAGLVLGAALRPVVPLRPKATVFFYGPKGGGKSFAAGRMMGFWERTPGAWADVLPGSAKDTVTYIEHCVARTPIWVADDLAPSAVKSQAEAENAKLADLVRNIFNNASKGRMNANMTSRKSNKPIAQLVITAENTLTTPSVKERLIPAFLGAGKLNPSREPTDYLEKIANEDGIPARLTAHLIQFVMYSSANLDGGWAAYIVQLQDRVASLQDKVEKMIKEKGAPAGSLKRVSTLAADIVVTIDLLRKLAHAVGASRETKRLLTDHELIRDIVDGVYGAHIENQKHAPGQSTVRAMSNLLMSGKAHLVNAHIPALPPLIDEMGADRALDNMKLGWVINTSSEGGLKPGGTCIGVVVQTPKFGPVVLFYPEVAFHAAQDAYPEIIQHGQQAQIAWSSVWDERLTPAGVTRRKSNHGSPINTWRNQGLTGVPVAVDTILRGGVVSTGLNDDADDDADES